MVSDCLGVIVRFPLQKLKQAWDSWCNTVALILSLSFPKMSYSFLSVPAQTDDAYSAIASNQCSWAAYEFAIKQSDLKRSFLKDPEEFVSIYKGCLERASRLRASAGSKHLYGENIDTPELIKYYEGNTRPFMTITEMITIKKNISDEFLDILHDDLRREFYSRTHGERSSIESAFSGIFGSSCAVVSRHGQSLAVIPFMSRYLICDSHLHTAFLASKADMMKHVLMDNGGHLHLTIMIIS
jgi:hypothetical protein